MTFLFQSKLFKGSMLALLGAVLFSTKAIMVKLAYRSEIDPITLLSLRMLFSLPFFILMSRPFGAARSVDKIQPRQWLQIVVMGLSGYFFASWFDFEGLRHITAGLERLILFIYPTLVVIMVAILRRKPVQRIQWVSLALTYGGLALSLFELSSMKQEAGLWTGVSWIFGAALTYAIYMVGSGELIPLIGATRYTALVMIVAAIAILSLHAIIGKTSLWSLTREMYGFGILLAVVATVLPAWIVSQAIQWVGSGQVAIVSSIGPVSTILMGYFILGESFSLLEGLGTLLVLAGVLTISLQKGG